MKFYASLLIGLFMTAVMVAGQAMADDVLLSCDPSMRLRSSAECEAAAQIALRHIGCEISALGCQLSNYYQDGYDCSVSSDNCTTPDAADDGTLICPEGYRLKFGAGDSILSELTQGSRHVAEGWAARRIAVCRQVAE